MIACGLDPGLSAAGIATLDADLRRIGRAWTVRTSTAMRFEDRMAKLSKQIAFALDGADLLAIEDQHGVFHAKLRKGLSNPAAGRLEQVVGMARGLADARGIPVILLTPGRIRALLGLPSGAPKGHVTRATRSQVSGITGGASHHAVDAAAIALAGAREWRGRKVLERKSG